MEISSVQHQAMANNQAALMEQVMLSSTSNKSDQSQERKPSRPHPEQSLKCPRCDSTNTKFCYYNNYSLSQPRYFCKGCRRYWTQGGSLRNVPVGGGCRKNKRSSSSSKKPESAPQTLTASNSMTSNPLLSYAAPSHDLTLAPLLLGSNPNPNPNFLDILRSGFLDSANPEGFSNLCSYGFDGGLGLSSTATTATTTTVSETGDHDSKMMMMGHQWQLNDANNSNVGVDSARDYWSGGGGYNWQGIINSSLM